MREENMIGREGGRRPVQLELTLNVNSEWGVPDDYIFHHESTFNRGTFVIRFYYHKNYMSANKPWLWSYRARGRRGNMVESFPFESLFKYKVESIRQDAFKMINDVMGRG